VLAYWPPACRAYGSERVLEYWVINSDKVPLIKKAPAVPILTHYSTIPLFQIPKPIFAIGIVIGSIYSEKN
jgi:hypothetical protein